VVALSEPSSVVTTGAGMDTMSGGGAGSMIRVQERQYCSTSCVISTTLRQVVVGSIVTSFTGAPATVSTLMLMVVFVFEAEHV
jgi:hypothetical protein